jgi:hypothetical protein
LLTSSSSITAIDSHSLNPNLHSSQGVFVVIYTEKL